MAGLKEVRDESDRHGIRIMVELNKESDPSKILAYLFSKTDLQVYYHYNNVVIANRAPVKLGLIGLNWRLPSSPARNTAARTWVRFG